MKKILTILGLAWLSIIIPPVAVAFALEVYHFYQWIFISLVGISNTDGAKNADFAAVLCVFFSALIFLICIMQWIDDGEDED